MSTFRYFAFSTFKAYDETFIDSAKIKELLFEELSLEKKLSTEMLLKKNENILMEK